MANLPLIWKNVDSLLEKHERVGISGGCDEILSDLVNFLF